MKSFSLVLAPLALLTLTGCSVEEVAQSAADAAACTALSSTLSGISEAYKAGLVDSGVIASVQDLVGNQTEFLLSTALAQDLKDLGVALASSETGQGAQQRVDELSQAVIQKCQKVGVAITQ